MMSKKDYKRAASMVREARRVDADKPEIAIIIRDAFVEFFTGDNPRFSRDKFEDACEGTKV
jgi:hypothetical protein